MLLRIVFVFGAVFSYIVVAELGSQYVVRDLDSAGTDSNVRGFLERKREKRALYSLAAKGMKATLKLLNDAKELHSDDKFTRLYEKRGTYRTVVKDFKSVSPAEVSKFSLPGGYKGMFGKVGDRTIMIESRGDTRTPTMLILRSMGSAKEGKDKIVYVPKEGPFRKFLRFIGING